MITVLLVTHLIIVIALVGVVLLQRSEGGGLGIGGGSNSFMSARGTANVLTRTTAILAALFFVTSLALSILPKFIGGSHVNLTNGTTTTQPANAANPGGVNLPPISGTQKGILDALRPAPGPQAPGPQVPAADAPAAPAAATPATTAPAAATTPAPTTPVPATQTPATTPAAPAKP